MVIIPRRIQQILGLIVILGVDLCAVPRPAGADISSIRLIIQEATIVHTEVSEQQTLTHHVQSNPVEITYFQLLHSTTMERSRIRQSQTFQGWEYIVQDHYSLTGYPRPQTGQAIRPPQP